MVANMKDPDGQLVRWALKLQHYDYEILHQPCTQHLNADGLSRLPIYQLNIENTDFLYDMIVQQSKWPILTLAQQKLLDDLSKDTHVENNQLEKKIDNKWL